jgi:hypothetical protein
MDGEQDTLDDLARFMKERGCSAGEVELQLGGLALHGLVGKETGQEWEAIAPSLTWSLTPMKQPMMTMSSPLTMASAKEPMFQKTLVGRSALTSLRRALHGRSNR